MSVRWWVKPKATELLTLRVRPPTLLRYQRCRELMTALEGDATGDEMLRRAFDLLARRLRHELGKKGMPLPPPGQVKEPTNEQPFTGVRRLVIRVDP